MIPPEPPPPTVPVHVDRVALASLRAALAGPHPPAHAFARGEEPWLVVAAAIAPGAPVAFAAARGGDAVRVPLYRYLVRGGPAEAAAFAAALALRAAAEAPAGLPARWRRPFRITGARLAIADADEPADPLADGTPVGVLYLGLALSYSE